MTVRVFLFVDFVIKYGLIVDGIYCSSIILKGTDMVATDGLTLDQVFAGCLNQLKGRYVSPLVRVQLSDGRTVIKFPGNWLQITGMKDHPREGPKFKSSGSSRPRRFKF